MRKPGCSRRPNMRDPDARELKRRPFCAHGPSAEAEGGAVQRQPLASRNAGRPRRAACLSRGGMLQPERRVSAERIAACRSRSSGAGGGMSQPKRHRSRGSGIAAEEAASQPRKRRCSRQGTNGILQPGRAACFSRGWRFQPSGVSQPSGQRCAWRRWRQRRRGGQGLARSRQRLARI